MLRKCQVCTGCLPHNFSPTSLITDYLKIQVFNFLSVRMVNRPLQCVLFSVPLPVHGFELHEVSLLELPFRLLKIS